MKLFFAFLLILLLAFSGYHLSFRGFKLPLFARIFYLTGTEFLFLGLLLGPVFLNILDAETLKGLETVSALLLGWIGLLFGFQFEVAKLRRFPAEFFIAAIIEALITFVLVFLSVYYFLHTGTSNGYFTVIEPMQIVIALVLAAVSACTAQTGIALLAPDLIARHRKTVVLLRYISSIDGLIALLFFALVFFFHPLVQTGTLIVEVPWRTLAFSIGAILGLLVLYALFLTQRREEGDLTLVVIGMVALTSGIASILHFSPLIANFLIGFCLVNITIEKERIIAILFRLEKPVYLLLLIFLGANWRLPALWLLLPAVGYCLIRVAGKLIGGFAITRLSSELKSLPKYFGFGLLEQGGLSMAILFDFQSGFPCGATTLAVGTVLLAVVYSEFLSPNLLGKTLKGDKR